jgi:hypothetical protein
MTHRVLDLLGKYLCGGAYRNHKHCVNKFLLLTNSDQMVEDDEIRKIEKRETIQSIPEWF